jgi:hypothetical protein
MFVQIFSATHNVDIPETLLPVYSPNFISLLHQYLAYALLLSLPNKTNQFFLLFQYLLSRFDDSDLSNLASTIPQCRQFLLTNVRIVESAQPLWDSRAGLNHADVLFRRHSSKPRWHRKCHLFEKDTSNRRTKIRSVPTLLYFYLYYASKHTKYLANKQNKTNKTYKTNTSSKRTCSQHSGGTSQFFNAAGHQCS